MRFTLEFNFKFLATKHGPEKLPWYKVFTWSWLEIKSEKPSYEKINRLWFYTRKGSPFHIDVVRYLNAT